MTIEFTVPGRPIPQARPRVTGNGRHTYTPRRSVEYRQAVALCAKSAMRGKEKFLGAVSCDISLGFAVPKSYAKGKRMAAEHNIIRPVGKNSGDVDNHAKGIMDALKGICWVDDSQVVRLSVSKWYGRECAKVTISEVEGDNADIGKFSGGLKMGGRTMNKKLKPCNCGGTAGLVYDTDDTDGILHYQWFAACENYCGMHTAGYETEEEAVEAWNRMQETGQ